MAYKREITLVLLMLVLVFVVWMLVSRLETTNNGAQTQFVVDAVHNAALTCYAVEGAYPSGLEYLRSNYGLAYDENRYMVRYDMFASNLMPDISVIEVEGDAP